MEQPNGKNNELYARIYAADICDLFEELLEEYDITIPSDDREGEDGEARIYGTVYYDLETRVTEILAKLCEEVKAAPEIAINIEDYNGFVDKGVSSMKYIIKTAMEDMLQRNCICDYVFSQNGQEVYQKNIYALDAYMMAYDMSTKGNVECYMAPNNTKANKPVFAIIDGVITLSGQTIKKRENTLEEHFGTDFEESYEALLDISAMSKQEVLSSIIDLDDKLENMLESEIDENVYEYIKNEPEIFTKIEENVFKKLPAAVEKYQIGAEIIDGETNGNCFYNCDAVYMEAICEALEGVVEPVECGRGMITLKANSVDRAIEEAKNRIESSGEKQNSEPDIVKE